MKIPSTHGFDISNVITSTQGWIISNVITSTHGFVMPHLSPIGVIPSTTVSIVPVVGVVAETLWYPFLVWMAISFSLLFPGVFISSDDWPCSDSFYNVISENWIPNLLQTNKNESKMNQVSIVYALCEGRIQLWENDQSPWTKFIIIIVVIDIIVIVVVVVIIIVIIIIVIVIIIRIANWPLN